MSSLPSRRALIRGSVQPPPSQPTIPSYTQIPSSRDNLLAWTENHKDLLVTEFASRAVPQPFLDPSILQARIQADQQFKLGESKKTEASASSPNQ